MKKLNHYSVEEVIETYEINRVFDCATLTAWVQTPPVGLSDFEHQLLTPLPADLLEWQYGWNEEELKINFIGPVLRVANLNVPKSLGMFFERSISGVVQNHKISVVCDCMVASPTLAGRPKKPYFFMQEFKRSKGDSHDPEGQMLAAMILAQDINQDANSVYGCWIQGKNWNFTVLHAQEYCVSHQFDATNFADLLQIVSILRRLKDNIMSGLIA